MKWLEVYIVNPRVTVHLFKIGKMPGIKNMVCRNFFMPNFSFN